MCIAMCCNIVGSDVADFHKQESFLFPAPVANTTSRCSVRATGDHFTPSCLLPHHPTFPISMASTSSLSTINSRSSQF
ncbi:hypothetical protein L1987_38308 [Smallanthus sonchifolius]|uniref:Uncharacterized protein n=1 Tax=Smallanthus sonchifolius TaxID=185202 RepID=A0ACB9HJJ2_9ASTR|nr:hypothetical protein L1987_38308 [Smallanthus sonchifolius]